MMMFLLTQNPNLAFFRHCFRHRRMGEIKPLQMHECSPRHEFYPSTVHYAPCSLTHDGAISMQVTFSFGGAHPCWADTHYMRRHHDTAKLQQLSQCQEQQGQERQRRQQRASSAESWRIAQVEHERRLRDAEREEHKQEMRNKARKQRKAQMKGQGSRVVESSLESRAPNVQTCLVPHMQTSVIPMQANC